MLTAIPMNVHGSASVATDFSGYPPNPHPNRRRFNTVNVPNSNVRPNKWKTSINAKAHVESRIITEIQV